MRGFDAEEHRRSSREAWEDAASGWRRSRETISRFAEPVSRRLLDAVDLQPGQRVLELAAGLGELGAQAAKRVLPGGSVVVSDQAETMLEGARELAAELGVENVEFRELNAEWIDFPLACFDAVLC
ncbi:MAG: class I SAM-dependent methyltransferase, partial [Solirubrobacteraceae bacterium]